MYIYIHMYILLSLSRSFSASFPHMTKKIVVLAIVQKYRSWETSIAPKFILNVFHSQVYLKLRQNSSLKTLPIKLIY